MRKNIRVTIAQRRKSSDFTRRLGDIFERKFDDFPASAPPVSGGDPDDPLSLPDITLPDSDPVPNIPPCPDAGTADDCVDTDGEPGAPTGEPGAPTGGVVVADWGYGDTGLVLWRLNDQRNPDDYRFFVVDSFSSEDYLGQSGGYTGTKYFRQINWLLVPKYGSYPYAPATHLRLTTTELDTYSVYFVNDDGSALFATVGDGPFGTVWPEADKLPDKVVSTSTGEIVTVPLGKRVWIMPGSAMVAVGETVAGGSPPERGWINADLTVWYNATSAPTPCEYASGSVYTRVLNGGPTIWDGPMSSIGYIVGVWIDDLPAIDSDYSITGGQLVTAVPATSVRIRFVAA